MKKRGLIFILTLLFIISTMVPVFADTANNEDIAGMVIIVILIIIILAFFEYAVVIGGIVLLVFIVVKIVDKFDKKKNKYNYFYGDSVGFSYFNDNYFIGESSNIGDIPVIQHNTEVINLGKEESSETDNE